MHQGTRSAWLCGAAALALLLPAGSVFAQDVKSNQTLDGEPERPVVSDQNSLGIIVVTARKRAEDIQDVPDAISVISQQVVEAGDLDEVEDFIDLVPNASFSNDSETSSEISIRGSSRNNSDEDPSVGIYRDGIYVGGLLFSTATFYDLERVEILRGPQAALYGRNAVGGAVNVVTTEPSFDPGGFVEVQIGSKARQEIRAGLDVPLVDDLLAARVSGLIVNQNRGFDYIVNQDNYTDAEEVGSIRGRLLFTPTSNLDFLTTVEYVSTSGGQALLVAAPDQETGFLDAEFTVPIPGTSPEDTDNQFRDFPTFSHFDQIHFFQEANLTTGAGTFTGIVSYRESSLSSSRDDDYTNNFVFGREYDASQDSFFSELRFATEDIGGFKVLVGLNYIDENTDLSYVNPQGGNFFGALGGVNLADMYATGILPPQLGGAADGSTSITSIGLTPGATGLTGFLGDTFPLFFVNQQSLQSFAAFADVNYEITDQLEVWGNVRYTKDDKEIIFAQGYTDCPVACPELTALFLDGLDFEVSGTNESSFENVSFGGGINFQPSDTVLLYAKVVEGFKAGGFNPVTFTPSLQAFDSEESISYEIGFKTEFFDNRLRVNASAFLQDRSGSLVDVEDPASAGILNLGVNGGEIRNKGVELEVSASPVEGLRLDVAGGYLDSKFREVTLDPAVFLDIADFTGNRVPLTFRYTLAAIMTYNRPITEALNLFGFASYRNAWNGFTDNENDRKLDNPEVVDLRLGVEGIAGWKVNGFVDNVFDNRYRSTDIAGNRIPRGRFSAGRTYGVQFGYEF